MNERICKVYYQYMTGIGYILQSTFSYLIVGASFAIRYLIIFLSEKIRFFSFTEETQFALTSVFWITFLNYGIIYLVAAWDCRNSHIPFVTKLFDGLYPDFNALWFNDIGVLIVAIMLANLYWPQLEFFMYWGIRLLYRMWDQRTLFPTNERNTRCKTPQAFEEIYSGPPFELSYKYSYILVVTYITFLFGAGVPILFPIAYVSLLGFYIVERLMMAYSYRRPPMFGTETNQVCLKALLGAPVVYCVFAMWMFNNQQVFENKLVANKGQHLFADSDHNLTDIWTHMTPGMPYAILLTSLLLLAIFKSCVKLLEKKLGCDCFSKRFKIKVVQSLEPFYQALSQRQLQSFIKEE